MNMRFQTFTRPATALAFALLAGTALSTAASAEAPKLCLNQFVSVPVIQEAVDGFREGLDAAKVSQERLNIQNPEADPATQLTLAQGFVNDKCDVIIAVATPGAQVFRRLTTTIPVVFIGVSTPVEAGIVESMERPGTNFTGVSDPAPVESDIDAMLKVMPGMKRVGLVYKAGDPAGDFLAARAVKYLESLGLTPVVATIATAAETTQATQSLIGQVDAIQIPGDSTTLSGMAGILKIANDANVPVFGGLGEGVSQGTILSGSYNYREVGFMAADMVRRVLAGEDPATMAVMVPSAATFEVNTTQAAKLGLTIPAEITAITSKTY